MRGVTDADKVSHEFDDAIAALKTIKPEGTPLRTVLPWVVLLLDEAATYAHDWAKDSGKNRGAMPETIYRNELGLARAINEVSA